METKVAELCPATRKLQAGVALLLCATLSGCIGATPLPRRTRTPAGTEVKNIDLSFIHPGQTTRAEVKEKLKLIDTGYEGDRFFLGRWSSSSWGGWIVLAGMCCDAMGGGGRVWKSGNLLVEFDEAEVVKRSDAFSDSGAIRALTPVAENTPLQLSSPLELPVKYWKPPSGQAVPARIVLTTNSLDFEELGEQKKKYKFSLPARDVLRVKAPLSTIPDPTYTSPRLHCAHDLKKLGGPRGKDLSLQLTLPQLVTLMSYTSQAARAPAAAAKGEGESK